jgi:hypothetical protein
MLWRDLLDDLPILYSYGINNHIGGNGGFVGGYASWS